jgi:hypothetical protein
MALVLLGGIGVGVGFAMRDNKPNGGVAVVELFTSEGCSSCPPADALLAKLVIDGQAGVYPLAFHVDYWDSREWRDAFSDPRFSARQQAYAEAHHSRESYTPQMMVNGGVGFVGSDSEVAAKQISAALKKMPAVSIHVSATFESGTVTANCSLDGAAIGKTLNVALAERGIERKVTGGENAGRMLVHENIVRAFIRANITDNTMTIKVPMPADAKAEQCSIIAYVQDDLMHVLGANAATLTGKASGATDKPNSH